MIITRMLGGLGNQMFEYAMGLNLARKQKAKLKINTRAYIRSNWPYSLNNFSITATRANLLEILIIKKYYPKQYFDESYWLNTDNWTDWMGEKSFKEIESVIREEFTLNKVFRKEFENKNHSVIEQINESNSVSIHIRRTDYLEKQNLCIVLKPEYYTEAINIITQKVKNPRYFFFSDDIEWVKSNFTHQENSVFLSNKDYEDLTLMSLCKHNITANSTFSWWGAWLNKNPDKIVITPSKWFINNQNMEKSLIPKTWIKI